MRVFFLGGGALYCFILFYFYVNVLIFNLLSGIDTFICEQCINIKWQIDLYSWCNWGVKSTLTIYIFKNSMSTIHGGMSFIFDIICSVPHFELFLFVRIFCLFYGNPLIYMYTVLAACFMWWAEPRILLCLRLDHRFWWFCLLMLNCH